MARAKAVDNKNLIIDEYLQVRDSCYFLPFFQIKRFQITFGGCFFSAQFFHLELLANQRDEVNSTIVKDRLKKAGGANYDPKQNEGF